MTAATPESGESDKAKFLRALRLKECEVEECSPDDIHAACRQRAHHSGAHGVAARALRSAGTVGLPSRPSTCNVRSPTLSYQIQNEHQNPGRVRFVRCFAASCAMAFAKGDARAHETDSFGRSRFCTHIHFPVVHWNVVRRYSLPAADVTSVAARRVLPRRLK